MATSPAIQRGRSERHADRRDKPGGSPDPRGDSPGIREGSPSIEQLTQALDRLISLYDAWGKPDEAAKWRTELEKLKKKAKTDTASPAKP